MSDRFVPPEPVGEPFRADPSDPSPFVSEGDAPSVPVVEPAAPVLPGHPPTHSAPEEIYPVNPSTPPQQQPPQYGQNVRPAQPPAQRAPLNAEEKFARTAVWVGVASIFIFNVIFGPIAVVMGAMALQRGQKEKGYWAIGLGVAGTVIGVAVLILVSTGVMPTFDEMIDDLRNGR